MTKYGYARVSSKSQENNSSLEGQRQQLIENDLFGSWEVLTFNPEDSSGITVEEFKSEVEKTLLEMKKYSNV